MINSLINLPFITSGFFRLQSWGQNSNYFLYFDKNKNLLPETCSSASLFKSLEKIKDEMIDYSDLDEDDFIFLIDEFFITLFKPLIFKSDFLEDNEGVVRIIRNNENFQRMFERFNPKKIESAIISAFQIHTTIIKNSSLQKNKVNFIQEIEELDLLLKGNLIFDRKIIKGNFSKLFFNIYDNYRKSLNLTKLFIHLQHLHNKILNEKKKI